MHRARNRRSEETMVRRARFPGSIGQPDRCRSFRKRRPSRRRRSEFESASPQSGPCKGPGAACVGLPTARGLLLADCSQARQDRSCRDGWFRRQGQDRLARTGTVKMPAIDRFFFNRAIDMLGAGELKGLPAQLALLAQDGQGTERVTAVQRDRVVQHVQHTQGSHCKTPALGIAAIRPRDRPRGLMRWPPAAPRSPARRRRPPPGAKKPRTSSASRAARCSHWRRIGGH